MDQELKKRWVEALRSGKYKQGNGVLLDHTETGQELCCLGVLCDVIDPDGWLDGPNHLRHSLSDRPEFNAPLPRQLLSPSAQRTLTCMNDSECKSFDEIADWVEQNL